MNLTADQLDTFFKRIILSLIFVVMLAPYSCATENESEIFGSALNTYQPIKGNANPRGYSLILATDDLSLGLHRIGFLALSADGMVNEPTVRASIFYFDSDKGLIEQGYPREALYRKWPYGSRGLYTLNANFLNQGKHILVVDIPVKNGPDETVEISFDVDKVTQAPSVGDLAIKSVTKTYVSVTETSELTTGSIVDLNLYKVTLAEAIKHAKPLVVVFASPAFCSNAVCGPQVEILSLLQSKFADKADFVHVDLYQNPEQLQGDLESAVISTAVRQWRLPSDEWTFIIDSTGVIIARFQGFATFDEIQTELLKLL